MDSETGTLESVPLNHRQEALYVGLRQRRVQLRNGWRFLITAECLRQLGSVGKKVAACLEGQDAFRDWLTPSVVPWVDCDGSLFDSLVSIGVGEEIPCRPAVVLPAPLDCSDLKRLSGSDRVNALSSRYRYPLNIGTPGESEIAEELLRQLMVADRVKLEKARDFDADDVLLKLNLVGIYAGMKRDLRFLDALNYVYELPHRPLARFARNPQLLAGWLCIYARLLCSPGW
jgi:hypothetical protein